MPAKSKKQQRFFGMVHARQKGEKVGGPEVAKVAKEIDFNDAEDFASTKHKGLPEKVKSKKNKKEDKEDKMEKDKKDESYKSLWRQYVEQRELAEVQYPPPPPPPQKKPGFVNAAGDEVHYKRPPAPPSKVSLPRRDSNAGRDYAKEREEHGGRMPFRLQRKYMGNDVIQVPPHLARRKGYPVDPDAQGERRAPHTLHQQQDDVIKPPPGGFRQTGPQSLVP